MSDLTTPLGFKAPGSGKKRIPILPILSIVTVALAVGVGLWIFAVDDPLGGEPVAVAKIGNAGGVSREDVTVVGVKSGVGRLLSPETAPEGEAAPAAAETTVVDASRMPTAALPDLQEETPHGPIPKIGAGGVKPMDAYARPTPSFVGSSPKIVVIVGGIGLSETGTQEALRQLPPEVTLALAPYGSDLGRWVTRARQSGHELLLQVPMEPFDYPDNDPGPQTLLAGGGPEKNIDNLHQLLAKASTYVGIVSTMGARFTAEAPALDPVMAELTRRGLLYVDEGTSSRSKARDVAAAKQTPFAGADLVIDQVASEGDILGRLAQLEQIARSRGMAVGMASALPISLREIGAWAKGLEPRGILLVPVSAAVRHAEGAE